MTWGNPPKIEITAAKKSKPITSEQIAGASEGSQQKALMVWAALASSQYPQLKYLFHIPNGGTRNIREAVELKAQGVKAGVPDLFLPCPSNGYHGCFLELKVGKNRPSIEQLAWMHMLREFGYYCKVCYSWIEAKETLISYLEGKC